MGNLLHREFVLHAELRCSGSERVKVGLFGRGNKKWCCVIILIVEQVLRKVKQMAQEMADRLLANPVMETYDIEVLK